MSSSSPSPSPFPVPSSSSSSLARRLLATSLVIAGGVASVATSEPHPEPGGTLTAEADGPALVLGSAASASSTITIALNEAAVPGESIYGGLFVDASACMPVGEAPGRLRISLVPELPMEGSVFEREVPACPATADFRLDLFVWSSCVAEQACAERYDLHFESVGPAVATSGMNVVFAASASASSYDEDYDTIEGAELTLVIE